MIGVFPIITRNSDFLFPDPEDYYLMGLGTTTPRGWGPSTFVFLPSAAGPDWNKPSHMEHQRSRPWRSGQKQDFAVATGSACYWWKYSPLTRPVWPGNLRLGKALGSDFLWSSSCLFSVVMVCPFHFLSQPHNPTGDTWDQCWVTGDRWRDASFGPSSLPLLYHTLRGPLPAPFWSWCLFWRPSLALCSMCFAIV